MKPYVICIHPHKKLICCGQVPRMKLGCVVRLPPRLISRQPGSQCGPSRKGLDLSHLVLSVTKSVIRAVSINPRRGGAYVPARAPGVHHRVRLEADDAAGARAPPVGRVASGFPLAESGGGGGAGGGGGRREGGRKGRGRRTY